MKKKIQIASSVLMIITVLAAMGIFTGCGGEAETVTVTAPGPTVTTTSTKTTTITPSAVTGEEIISILNPATVSNQVERVPLAPRLDTLEGKSIYLIDVNWGSGDLEGAYVFLTLTAEWLEEEYNCTTKVVKKKGAYFFGDPDLFAEAGENADAVIFGISG